MVAEFLLNREAVTQRFLPENKQSPLCVWLNVVLGVGGELFGLP